MPVVLVEVGGVARSGHEYDDRMGIAYEYPAERYENWMHTGPLCLTKGMALRGPPELRAHADPANARLIEDYSVEIARTTMETRFKQNLEVMQ